MAFVSVCCGRVVRTPPVSKANWTSRWPLGTQGSDQVKRPKAEPCAGLWDCLFTSVCPKLEKKVDVFTSILISGGENTFIANALTEQGLNLGSGSACVEFTCFHGFLSAVLKTGSAGVLKTTKCVLQK